MSTQTMSDIAAPLRLLRLLAADHPDLPAMNVDVSTIFPNQLELVSHDDFGAFEAWRQAAGISSETVTYAEQSQGRTRVLRAAVDYGGARLSLVAYSTVPGHERGEVL
ncbi:hypothetical protein OG528_10330 [Streptomyces platensis]|uniref:hypothetical protein n=1 Tax=Streptomyces platensis TaxID=58346 RepID=UPI0030DE8C48